jgi:hypothetical protein
MNSNYYNISLRQIPEVDDFEMYTEVARFCFIVTFTVWFMTYALNCCITPFTDQLIGKMKEYERKLDEADDIMCEYENQIELLKSQIKELNEQDDDSRKIKRSRID